VFESNTNKEPKHDNQKSCLNVLLTQALFYTIFNYGKGKILEPLCFGL